MKKNSSKIAAMVKVATKAHANQYRNNNKVPYVRHCINVASIVDHVLEENAEAPSEQKLETLRLTGIGHDLFEDTSVGPQEISQRFGEAVPRGIDSLSNYDGDDNTKDYLKKIQAASDDTKLIKAADLVDNTLSVFYGLHDLGTEWVKSYYLPIAQATDKALRNTTNASYPKSYSNLLAMHRTWLQMLIATTKK